MKKIVKDNKNQRISKSPIEDIKEEREEEENRCPMCGKDVGRRKLCRHCKMCAECCTCGQEES